MNPQFFWYLARAAGLVTFALLSLSTVLGLCISSRLGGRDGFFERPWVFELHRFASLLALGFLGIHMAVLIPDPWSSFRVVDLLVPGLSSYRPLAVSAGVLAMYGALVGTFSFYIKSWIGYRTWRTIHFGTFATYALAMFHGLTAGADAGQPWVILMYLLSGFLVAWLTMYRLLVRPPPSLQGAVDLMLFDRPPTNVR